ncbi:hypothetical protein DL93DRAFT_301306 [Clavulina sp. PMI_390]|nr:hypothetical protein DL93DRAFT_301306 [Clavulina sp. PMI_390]
MGRPFACLMRVADRIGDEIKLSPPTATQFISHNTFFSSMGLQSFCSDARDLLTQLESLGEPRLSQLTQQSFSPHTRTNRAKTISGSLNHSRQLLELLGDLLKKTQSLQDSFHVEHVAAVNSVCPVLQLPDEVLRMIFVFFAEDEENRLFPTWLTKVCRRWRVTALGCAELWTSVDPADSIPLLQQSLQLSSNLPIEIRMSRHPPRKLREYENETGSMEDIIQQIQQRRIIRVSVMGEALDSGLALRDAFGRDTKLSLLPTDTISLFGEQSVRSARQMDMGAVDFLDLKVFELERCSPPYLRHRQLWCSHLRIHGLDAFPQRLIGFLEGFKHLESITICDASIAEHDEDGENDWWPALVPALRSITVINTTAQYTDNILDLIHTSEIMTLGLEFALASRSTDDSTSSLLGATQILMNHFGQPVNLPSFYVVCRRRR